MRRIALGATAASALWAAAQVAWPVTPPAGPVIDGSFVVNWALNTSLTGISPDAVKGTWLCSARAMNKPAIDAEIAKINALKGEAARYEFSSGLENRAYYLRQQATAEFAIVGGRYDASQTISIRVSRDDLIDQATQRAVELPGVLIGCWLRLTNAAGQTTLAYEGKKPRARASDLEVMSRVYSPPYCLVGASVPGG